MVEFGLAFPLLFLLLIGMFQFGYGFFLYNELQASVRSATRYAAQFDFDSSTGGATFQSNVQNMLVYGTPSGGSTPVVPNLSTSAVSVTWVADGAGIPQTVTVKISSYTFSALGTSFTLTNKPQATFIFLGQFVS